MRFLRRPIYVYGLPPPTRHSSSPLITPLPPPLPLPPSLPHPSLLLHSLRHTRHVEAAAASVVFKVAYLAVFTGSLSRDERERNRRGHEGRGADRGGAGEGAGGGEGEGGGTWSRSREVELTEVEQEKEPMTGGGGGDAANGDAAASSPLTEKNGSVNVKIPDEEAGATFTGLSKEELLRVAGTPGWVRTRCALLALFWLGWLGMLCGAVLIILQAPRCRPLPPAVWWAQGPLYQIGDVKAFSENLTGLQQKVDQLSKLKLKALVVGPLHVAPADDPENLDFNKISPDVGNLQQFRELVQAVHQKHMYFILDLTPNYNGNQPWFSNSTVTTVAEQLKSALMFWLKEGVDGVQLAGVERVASLEPSLWADIRAIVQNRSDDVASKKVLVGVTDRGSGPEVSALLNSSGVNLLLSDLLRSTVANATERAQSVQLLYSAHNQSQLAWNLGGRSQGHLGSLVGSAGVKVHQLLLFTLPGTPVFNYGDEIGLLDQETTFPTMLWDSLEPEQGLNGTAKEEREERASCLHVFNALAELRQREPALLYGDFLLLLHANSSSSSSLAYGRAWDQSDRYVAAFNWANEGVSMNLTHPLLGPEGVLVLGTGSGAPGTTVSLATVEVGPDHALLIKVPYRS
ncbi:4F2 cell-surface antigen heavy chain [Merluccius polli]|uniref:4F2 cell-surface antigen heavy chain n=1 Tax=Merluccius polli TaxID=89951 RepID=A0AA47MI91_MERPO|nr:4F2 cell-surface antigen heavy chain [Merluccius polli]